MTKKAIAPRYSLDCVFVLIEKLNGDDRSARNEKSVVAKKIKLFFLSIKNGAMNMRRSKTMITGLLYPPLIKIKVVVTKRSK